MHKYETDGGLKYPVQTGDVWGAGPHVLACGDLYSGAALTRALMVSGPANCVYVDPPWGAGVEKSFRTKAGLTSGPFVNYAVLIQIIYGIIKTVPGPAAVECGKKQIVMFREAANRAAVPETSFAQIAYNNGKLPAFLFGYNGAQISHCAGVDDTLTPQLFLRTAPGASIVLDPCTGRGATAVAAANLGMRFVGSELNPMRASVTLRKLTDLGHVPKLIHRDNGPKMGGATVPEPLQNALGCV